MLFYSPKKKGKIELMINLSDEIGNFKNYRLRIEVIDEAEYKQLVASNDSKDNIEDENSQNLNDNLS